MKNKGTLTIPDNAILMGDSNEWYFYYKHLEDDLTISFPKRIFSSQKEAERNYLKAVREFDEKIINIRNSTRVSFSFCSYIQYWLYEIQYPKVANRRKVVLNHVVNRIIIPSMQDNPLLTRVTSTYLDRLFQNCKTYSVTSGWMAQAVGGAILKSAIADQYIKTNPMDGVKIFPRNKPKFQVIAQKDIPVFVKEAYLYGKNAPNSEGIYLEVLLALFCGLRRGEIMGLRFEDFDTSEQTVTIKRQLVHELKSSMGENGEIFSRKRIMTICPKTEDSYRCLKINPVIFNELNNRAKYIDVYRQRIDYTAENEGYVCIQRNGTFKSESTISSAIKNIAARSGVPPVSCHDLRHTCATILLELGVEIIEIAKVLGHANPHTTLVLYCTTTESEQDIAVLFDEKLILGEG